MLRKAMIPVLAGFLAVSVMARDGAAEDARADAFVEPSADLRGRSDIDRVTRAALAYRDSSEYGYNYSISLKDNAVAACFHAADQKVRNRRRGLHARLDRIKKVKKRGDTLKITLRVTNIYRNGSIQHWVKCHVEHENVVFFKYA